MVVVIPKQNTYFCFYQMLIGKQNAMGLLKRFVCS